MIMEATAIQSVEKNITMVALANVQPSNYNPRKNFDEASLAELSFAGRHVWQGEVCSHPQRKGHRHRAALHGGRTHLWNHVHRPPHRLRVERLAYGQGTFRQRLAGTLHAALCRTAADFSFRSGGGTGEQARIFRFKKCYVVVYYWCLVYYNA